MLEKLIRPLQIAILPGDHGFFSSLHGVWQFTQLQHDASKIELDITFDFDSIVVAKLVGPLFSHIANSQVDAFYMRAEELYGLQS